VVAELRSISPKQIIETRFDFNEPVDCARMLIGQLLSKGSTGPGEGIYCLWRTRNSRI